ncbi:FkbM family methyltransferase [Hyphomonas sp.]|uniref:FkbM family methyltransferase n=1 Tax=Hyphomonas sp. TaxID=87 RepID=UPI000C4EEAEA|nr:FkbM family methyltransferase [Hyphomonas sp.]MAB10969.1 hypothetical protein [Hyphomonas sp.]MAU67534.1 hypothetical protein [Hyphomonas sp.]MBM56718.1 hypothetical protein [Hyphomonas sp.]
MDYRFHFPESSSKRNEMTFKYEPIQPLILLELCSRIGATRFFDVGANIGFYSLVATLIPSVNEIYAFEASRETFDELALNVRINWLNSKIKVENKAVSSENGFVTFQIASSLSGINSVAETSIHRSELFKDTVSVECIALDNYADVTDEVLALKIDVEGHEAHVVRGARKLLSDNICVIQIEDYGGQDRETSALLHELGYTKITTAKNDHYYSNAPVLQDVREVLGCMERAAGRLIDLYLGNWPPPRLVDALNVTGDVANGTARASCQVKQGMFDSAQELEYAFYIYSNNSKIGQVWYTQDANLNFALPDECRGTEISVRAFVRAKMDPEMKIAHTVKIGRYG